MKMFPKLAAAALVVATLSGCAAVQTGISHKDLNVQTKMTDTVFLEPVGPALHTVFLQIRNTSDKPDFNIDADLRQAIAAKGYAITLDPKAAHYVLQVNVLQVGMIDPSAAEQAFAGGYGHIMGATVAGAAVGGVMGHGNAGSMVAGGLLAGGLEMIADAAVKNVTYSVITDIQISERSDVKVFQNTTSSLKQGRSTTKTQQAVETVDKKSYQTRIMSTANQVNLDFPTAMPALRNGLINSVSGMF